MFRDEDETSENIDQNIDDTLIPIVEPQAAEVIKASKYFTFFAPIDDDAFDADTRSYCQKIPYDVLLPSFLESVSLSLVGFASTYLEQSTPWYRNPVLYSSIYLTANLFSRLIINTDLCIKKTFCFKNSPKNERALKVQGARCFNAASFAFANLPESFLLHEIGHLLASLAVFQNPQPKVCLKGGIFFPDGAYTYLENKTLSLSSFGEKIGTRNANRLLDGMGLGTDLIMAIIELTLAEIIVNKFPETSLHLRLLAMTALMYDIVYAVSAFSDNTCYQNNKPLPNDFCRLNEEGLSPALVLAIMAGLTLLFQLGLSVTHYLINNSSCRKEEVKVEELHGDFELTNNLRM